MFRSSVPTSFVAVIGRIDGLSGDLVGFARGRELLSERTRVAERTEFTDACRIGREKAAIFFILRRFATRVKDDPW